MFDWTSLLQRPIDPLRAQEVGAVNALRALQGDEMRLKMQEERRKIAGYNALGRILSNPENLAPGGLPNRGAMAQIMAADPRTGLALLGKQAQLENVRSEIASRNAKLAVDVDKMRDEHRNYLIDNVSVPAVTAYNDAIKRGQGPEAAQRAGQEAYDNALKTARASGRFSPGETAAFQPNFDLNRAQANILGREGMRQQMREQAKRSEDFTLSTDYGRTPPTQYRMYKDGRTTDLAGNPYTPTGVGAPKGANANKPYTAQVIDDKGGKTWATVRRAPAGGFVDDATGQPVKIDPTTLRTVGTSGAFNTPLSAEAIKQIADQYMAGDKSALQGLGWGAVGSANRAAVRDELARRGVKGADIAAAIAEFGGVQAGERTAAVRSANLGMALSEAKAFIPMAVQASEKVSRTAYPTLNSVILAYDRGTGDEDVVRLAVAVNALSNAYAQVAARGGQSTDAARAQAQHVLSLAYSKGQFRTAADQMMREIEAARSAPAAVRQELRQGITGASPRASAGAPGPASAVPLLHPGDDAAYGALPSGATYRYQRGDGSIVTMRKP